MNRLVDTDIKKQGLESASGQNVESSSLSNIVKGKENLLCSEDLETVDLRSRAITQEKEIMYLREQIAIASMKESQLLNEKYSSERKFSELRMALDEKQNEAVTTALNELARRKGDLEVNFNLLNELKATDDERHIFTTSMLGVLAEYDAWPHVINASSLSNSIKARLLEMNSRIENDTRNGFNGQLPNSSMGIHGLTYYDYIDGRHLGQAGDLLRDVKDYDPKNINSLTHAVETPHLPNNEILLMTSGIDRNVTDRIVDNILSRNVTQTQVSDPSGIHNGIESFGSEDEGPGIENFQIIGNAKPGCKLLGCGYPVRGTSLCMFQWVRHYPDGTRQYIEGATNPDYVITADDVDKIIAVECIPMDEKGRQGELVRIFANDHNKITCDEEMQEEIDSYTAKGEAKFNVLILLDSSENWEQATLYLRRSGFQVKLETSQPALIVEKYSEDLLIKIPGGLSTQFVLTCANGSSYPFSTSNDIRMRDKAVLTMGIFQSKALEEGRKAKA